MKRGINRGRLRHMLTALALLLQTQVPSIWAEPGSKPLEAAEKARKLVMVLYPSSDSDVTKKAEELFDDPAVVKSLSKCLCVRFGPDLHLPRHSPVQVPAGCSLIEFRDHDWQLRGLAYSPMDPNLFVRWTDTVDASWKKHDSLVFRSKGRLNDEDTARLAFSFAMRGQTDQASGLLFLMQTNRRVEEAEFGWMALALAYSTQNQDSKAQEAWMRLATLTRAAELKSAAKCGIASTFVGERPKNAYDKFKEVANSDDSPAVDRWRANHEMTLLFDRIKGG